MKKLEHENRLLKNRLESLRKARQAVTKVIK